MPASCSLTAMHRPDMPAPIIATFTGRFCVMVATCTLAGLHVTPTGLTYRWLTRDQFQATDKWHSGGTEVAFLTSDWSVANYRERGLRSDEGGLDNGRCHQGAGSGCRSGPGW